MNLVARTRMSIRDDMRRERTGTRASRVFHLPLARTAMIDLRDARRASYPRRSIVAETIRLITGIGLRERDVSPISLAPPIHSRALNVALQKLDAIAIIATTLTHIILRARLRAARRYSHGTVTHPSSSHVRPR